MEKCLFTIIVPVYNVEKYLSNCLDSIINQTYKGDFETIIVNDGSTDDCLNIINRYREKINNIKIISRENHGLLYSRVEAVKNAKGKYIIFVDSDDYVPSNTLEVYYKYIKEDDFDIIRGNYYSFGSKENIKECDDFQSEYVIKICDIKSKIYDELLKNNKFNSVWRQAIKKEIIALDEIDTSVSMGEDIVFNQACYKNIYKMKIITEHLYYYRLNQKSMTHDFSIERLKKNINDMDKAYTSIINNIKQMSDIELLKLSYCSYLKLMNAYNFFLIKHTKDKKIINEYIDITLLGKKNEEAQSIIKFKDIKFKNRRVFIYLLLKKRKRIYINLVRILTNFMKI